MSRLKGLSPAQILEELAENYDRQVALADELEETEEWACQMREALLPLLAIGQAMRVLVGTTIKPRCITLWRDGDNIETTVTDLMPTWRLRFPDEDTIDGEFDYRDC